jgi:hypothetical protein
MSDYHYPHIDELVGWALQTVLTLASEDSQYLRDPQCPYDEKTKRVINDALSFRQGWQVMKDQEGEKKQETPPSTPISEDEIDSTLAEDLYTVFTELKNYGKTIAQSDQTERMAYFRTATSLLERLVNARERALGVKQIKDFQDTVLTIMEDTLTTDQRTEVMERLRSAIVRSAATEDDASLTTTDENA